MLISSYIDKQINEKLRLKNDAERAKHTPSGKLSASSLSHPLQWQVLKVLGVGQKVFDDYLLRKFIRGQSVEDWIAELMPDVLERQKKVEYKNVVGYADLIVDTSKYDFNVGTIPFEVKSVTNAKFKRIKEREGADPGHKLQAGLYGLAENSKHYGLVYIASDDLRILTYIYETKDIEDEIHKIINEFEKAVANQFVPAFVPRYKWQAIPEYNMYPEWANLNQKEVELAIAFHYPDAWEKFRKAYYGV
jgi:hypothetical protein